MLLERRLILTVSLFVISLFLLVGTSAWFILSFFPQNIEESFEKVYKTQAQSVGEHISAQFFERYGDIQAMAEATSLIMDVPNSKQKIEKLLNTYTRLYRLYDFIMIVDSNGQILATNNEDVTGKKIQQPSFSTIDIKNSDWFKKPMSGTFTDDPGKSLQGTYFSLESMSPQIDMPPAMHSLFSAVVYKNGRATGIIVSYSRLDWITQVVQEQYMKFLKLGMSATALRVVDGLGHTLASYGVHDDFEQTSSSSQGIIVGEPIESARFPMSLDWRVQMYSPRSDVRQLIQYSKFYYSLLAVLFFGALSVITIYFGRQLKSYSKERTAATAEQAKLEGRLREQSRTLESTLHDLKSMQERAVTQEKMAGLGVMATGLAHEIKNPLNVVINSSQYLIDYYMGNRIKGDANEARRFAEMIVKHSERIDTLIKAILLSARKDSGEVRVVVDVNELVKESLQVCLKTFQIQNQVAVPSELYTSATPAKVKVDIEDLRRAILNLIDNALYSLLKKWTIEGMSNALLKVKVEKQESMIVLIIEDNGVGISTGDAKNIFTPFFTTKEPGKGTGLGLSMSADLMKKYGGSIYFESEQDVYCRFFIKLPAYE